MANLPAYKVNDFIKGFVKEQNHPHRLWLLYGPEVGLSSERQELMVKSLQPEKDPFRFCQLTQGVVLEQPHRFFDEMLAMGFGGGKRLLVITEVDDRLYDKVMADFLKDPAGDNDLLLVAGNLGKQSALRAGVEKSTIGIALPAYQDSPDMIRELLNQQLSAFKVTMQSSAKDWLCQQLGGNRLETKRVIEQLCLYGLGSGDEKKEITLEEARLFIHASHDSVDKFITAVLTKNTRQLLLLQEKLQHEKIEPLILIRRMITEINRMATIHEAVMAGRGLEQTIEQMVPFFKNRPTMGRALKLFHYDKLPLWRKKLLDLENQMKSALPSLLLTERLFLEMAVKKY